MRKYIQYVYLKITGLHAQQVIKRNLKSEANKHTWWRMWWEQWVQVFVDANRITSRKTFLKIQGSCEEPFESQEYSCISTQCQRAAYSKKRWDQKEVNYVCFKRKYCRWKRGSYDKRSGVDRDKGVQRSISHTVLLLGQGLWGTKCLSISVANTENMSSLQVLTVVRHSQRTGSTLGGVLVLCS